MLLHYPVEYQKQTVGYLTITQEGLYCHYTGTFKINKDGIYRVYALTSKESINLGVCKPDQDGWKIHGKIPANKIKIHDVRFEINCAGKETQIIPLCSEKPFIYLDELERYRFYNQDECVGVFLSPDD